MTDTNETPVVVYGQWVAEQARKDLPETAKHHTTRAVVDWLAALIAGGHMQPAALLADVLIDETDEHGKASLVPGGQRCGARTAALINGAAAHTAEVDDIFRDGIYHPGAPTIAAAVALGQTLGSSGADVGRAVAIGYEVSTRIAAAIQPAHYRYWHTTGTVGTFGAAAAGSALLKLNGEQSAHAIATAATFASGLQQAFRSDAMSKPMHSGHAAEAGLLAAMGASRGLTGAMDVLNGAAGFGAAMADQPDWALATSGLGEKWNVVEMTFKAHAACGHTFSPVDGALQLRDEEQLDVTDIVSVVVETAAIPAEVAGNPEPTTAFEAKFSIPYAVASALVRGHVQLAAFEEEALAETQVLDLMRRVTITVDPELTKVFPAQRAAKVLITLSDGRTVTAMRWARKGDPEDPLTDGDLKRKFTSLVEPIIGAPKTADVAELAWRLFELRLIDELVQI